MELLKQPETQPYPHLTETDAERLLNSPQMLREVVSEFEGFCAVCLPHYLTLPPADFHPELMRLLADPQYRFLSIIGFRGSAKSSLTSLALPLWSALQKKAQFILPFAETEATAKLNLANIRHELETNEAIKAIYGDQSNGVNKQREWTHNALLFANGTRIMSRSRGQRVRGLRHRQYRPDLVIVDDPEELAKVGKKEYRDKTESWLRGDVMPAIEETGARLIVIGNILNTDALMARLKRDEGFTHRDYALVDAQGNITWKAKYPDKEALKAKERSVGHNAFLREYLLKVIPPEGQEIKDEWIQYYDDLPRDAEGKPVMVQAAGVGVDLAISKSEKADFTTMVSGVSFNVGGTTKIYILPNPVSERLSAHETIQKMIAIRDALKAGYAVPLFYMEDVAYQKAAIEMAQRAGLAAKGMRAGQDKRSRLRTAATFIQNGTILFPRKGCEDLINQLTGFGVEDHDDLADGLVYMIFGMTQHGMKMPQVVGIL